MEVIEILDIGTLVEITGESITAHVTAVQIAGSKIPIYKCEWFTHGDQKEAWLQTFQITPKENHSMQKIGFV